MLGPLLFLAYINDLPETTVSSNTRIFADDTLLCRPITCQHDSTLLQQDLNALEEWETNWQMDFNASKCSVIHILPSKRKQSINTTYTLHGEPLETEEASKYLGVTITNNLTWTRHTENVIAKGNRTLGFLRRNFRDCTTPVKAATYTTMVRPTLEYASSVWDPHLQKDIKALEQVQRRAARYVLNDYSTRTPGCVSNMVNQLQWESLESRRRTDRLMMLYKIQNGLVDIQPDSFIQQSDRRTRGEHRLYQERIGKESYNNSFFPRTIRDWNMLPSQTTSAPTLEGFRANLTVCYPVSGSY